MGKEQELLDAARTGNCAIVNKLLSHRLKRSGPLASLRRGPSPNSQDSSGYTSLHHAALNGHKDIVQILLEYQASPNLTDTKGLTPLHLAAWSGNCDIVKLMLSHSPRITNVNQLTREKESALHYASQYGHHDVVRVLLNHDCDPTLKNSRNETALDLASLYGRLETVQLLLDKRSDLLKAMRKPTQNIILMHSPLHLASRNGHNEIVEELLDAGFYVNLKTRAGTALHEAALCGKIDVVRTLLDHRIDLSICNDKGKTVLDLLQQFPTQVSHDLLKIIESSQSYSDSGLLPPVAYNSDNDRPYSPFDDVPEQFRNDFQPLPNKWTSQDNEFHNRYQTPIDMELDQISYASSASSSCFSRDLNLKKSEFSSGPITFSNHSSNSAQAKLSPTEFLQKPYRRNLSISPSRPKTTISSVTARSETLTKSLDFDNGNRLRHIESMERNLSKNESEKISSITGTSTLPQKRHEYVLQRGKSEEFFESSKFRRQLEPIAITEIYDDTLLKKTNPKRKLKRPAMKSCLKTKSKDYDKNIRIESDSEIATGSKTVASHDTDTIKQTNRFKDNEMESKRISCTGTDRIVDDADKLNEPLANTVIRLPPTVQQAENLIFQTIQLLNQQPKCTKNVQTETEPELTEDYDDLASNLSEQKYETTSSLSSGSLSVKSRINSGSSSIEEFQDQINPFIGLLKGSSLKLVNCNKVPEMSKSSISNRNCDNTNKVSLNDFETSATLAQFDEQREWGQIDSIVESFGSDFVNKSVFVDELEKEFQSRLKGISITKKLTDLNGILTTSTSSKPTPTTIGKWLKIIGYENWELKFISCGFDDIDFINGVLDDDDLKELGIRSEKDIGVILKSASQQLPNKINDIKQFYKELSEKTNNSETDDGLSLIDKWLKSIRLEQYSEVFRKHSYIDFERIQRIWDIELSTILEIEKIGHRKRILISVSDNNRFVNRPKLEDLNNDLKLLKHSIEQLKQDLDVNEQRTKQKYKKKSRPAPPPPVSICQDRKTASEALTIREPSELLIGNSGGQIGNGQIDRNHVTEWKHEPMLLISSSIAYIANYLGSTIVHELKGMDSTKQSIKKLKKSVRNPKPTPEVILSISIRGVRFLNTITQETICEHDIKNIHCVCQDVEDFTHFAYITKDHDSQKHYCHVFSMKTMNDATEVILTLGEAFEVAYQMKLKNEECK